MIPILFAVDVAPLYVKLMGACLAGLVPGILSGRLRADGKIVVFFYLLASVVATTSLHNAIYFDPTGLIAMIVGFTVGLVVFVISHSKNASVFAAVIVTLIGLVALGVVVSLRMPPTEIRHAIAQIQRGGGAVQQSDNHRTYRDPWWVSFKPKTLDDNRLIGLASDLQKLPKLWLTLSSCYIGDRGLSGIAQAENIVKLDLDGTQVTDYGLLHLSELSHLERLDLSRTQISDEGLHNLSRLVDLETLLLYKTAVTQSGVRDLRRSLPKCYIIFDEHQ